MTRTPRPFIIPIFLPQAGCPHRCLFCHQTAITDTEKPISPERLKAEAERFLRYKTGHRGRTQISFYGGNFLGLPPKQQRLLLQAAETMVQEKKIDSIRFSTRPDTITMENLNRIQDYSVTSVEIGLQSLDNRVLAYSCRGHTAEQSKEAILRLQEAGYETTAQMMTGLPGDSGRESLETGEKIIQLAPDSVRIYPTAVVAGTGLAALYRQGRYHPQSLEEAVNLVKTLYLRFTEHGITVIRMGLHPSRELRREGILLAGPYHPAFGHLVLSEIWFDRILQLAKTNPPAGEELIIKVHPSNVSKIRGLKNRNLKRLQSRLGTKAITLIEDSRMDTNQVFCQQEKGIAGQIILPEPENCFSGHHHKITMD